MGTLYRIFVIILDIALKFSFVILSIILFGIEVTLTVIAVFLIIGMIPYYYKFYHNKIMDEENDNNTSITEQAKNPKIAEYSVKNISFKKADFMHG